MDIKRRWLTDLVSRLSWCERMFFVVLFSFLVVRQSLWALINPMFQAPDETAHLLMVAQIDKNGLGFYKDQNATVWKSFESSVHFHEDYYRQKGIEARADRIPPYVPRSRWASQEKETLHVAGFDKDEGTDTWRHAIFTYPPLYYYTTAKLLSLLRLVKPTLITYQFAARLFGVGFYLAFILVLTLLGFKLFDGMIKYFFVAMIVFHPMFTFMTSVCNNDIPLFPLSALLFLGVAEVLRQGMDGKIYALLLITSLLSTLTKAQGFLLGSIVLLFLCFVSLWKKDRRASLYLGIGLLGNGVLYLMLPLLTGDLRLNGAPDPMGLIEYIGFLFEEGGWMLLAGTLGMFAWYEVKFGPLVYHSFSCISSAFAILGIVLVVRCVRNCFSNWRENTLVFLFGVYLTYLFAGLAYQFTKMAQIGFFIQGRYFLSAFPVMYLVATYLLKWPFSTRHGESNGIGLLLALVTTGCLVYLNNWGLYLIIRRFYVTPGVAPLEVVNRIMQYKPAFFKSDIVFYGLVTYCFVSQAFIVWSLLKAALRGVGLRRLLLSPSG